MMDAFGLFVTVDWGVLWAIILLVIIDLSVRYFAFKRLESAAIDIALFSFAYSTVELGRRIGGDDAEVEGWLKRAGVGVACMLALTVLHIVYADALSSHVDQVLRRFPGSGPVRRTSVSKATPLIVRVVLVTFSGPEVPAFIRQGKRNWREEAVEFINAQQTGLAPSDRLTESDLLLSRTWRFVGAFVFFVLGLVSILIPATTIIS